MPALKDCLPRGKIVEWNLWTWLAPMMRKRMARASTSYESSRRTGPPLLWPDGGVTGFHPLLDEVLGDNHVVAFVWHLVPALHGTPMTVIR